MTTQKETFCIDNGILRVTIAGFGAELVAVESCDGGVDYLWSGKPEHWSGCAPILFPIVGALRDGKAVCAIGDIEMPQHGLVKKMTWQLFSKSDTEMTFVVVSDENTKKAYPFDFKLYVKYSLAGNALTTEFTVENPSKQAFPYCIGGHPGINVPLVSGEAFDDYYIEFEMAETADCPMVNQQLRLIDDTKTSRLLTNSKKFGLNHALFRGDALIFDDLKSRNVTLASSKSGHGVSMDFSGFDYFAVWTTANDSPFVCLEPWTGMATTISESDVFEKKRGMKLLQPESREDIAFSMTFF